MLNPKAVKYMQLVFSLKDAISKRETREISSQFGVTATQVLIFIPFHFQWLVKRSGCLRQQLFLLVSVNDYEMLPCFVIDERTHVYC